MGDITDFDAYRKLRESDDETVGDGDIRCRKCEDALFIVCLAPDYTEVDVGGPYALLCQHCYEPLGSAYLFNEDDLEEE